MIGMSSNTASRGFGPLNLIARRSRSAYHCEISCDDACFKPAPNRSGNEPFAAILNRRISRRSLVRAAVAAGCDGLFLEVHPTPASAPSDGSNMLPLEQLAGILHDVVAIRSAM